MATVSNDVAAAQARIAELLERNAMLEAQLLHYKARPSLIPHSFLTQSHSVSLTSLVSIRVGARWELQPKQSLEKEGGEAGGVGLWPAAGGAAWRLLAIDRGCEPSDVAVAQRESAAGAVGRGGGARE